MKAIDVSAVEYLNAQPLVHGLKARTDLFTLRFDVPSKCATLLHDKTVDLALIPSIEYLRNDDCRIVPGMAVASTGPVASVALFTDRPATAIRSIAVDASSRTAAALLRVLSAEWFDIEPTFVTLRPDLTTMLKRCDAALLIGDAALYQEHETNGLDKIDLGQEWAAMTGLPFVWAVWAGREDVVSQAHVEALTAARDAGMQSLDAIADQFVSEGDDEETKEIARAYLRENVTYVLDEQCRAGLKKFFTKVADLQLAPTAGTLRFFK